MNQSSIFFPIEATKFLVEREHEKSSELISYLTDFCEMTRQEKSHLTCELSPFAIWNAIFKKRDVRSALEKSFLFSSYPVSALLKEKIETEIKRAEKLITEYQNAESRREGVSFEKASAVLEASGVVLRTAQQSAISQLFPDDKSPHSGIVSLPSGAGKTMTGLFCSKMMDGRTWVFGPDAALSEWYQQATKHALYLPKEISKLPSETTRLALFSYQLTDIEKWSLWMPPDLVILDEVHRIPDALLAILASPAWEGVRRLGLSATPQFLLAQQERVFKEVGPLLYSQGTTLEAPTAYCYEVLVDFLPEERNDYLLARRENDRYRYAGLNTKKIDKTVEIIAKHPNLPTIIFGEYLPALEVLSTRLKVGHLSGESSLSARQKAYKEFREGKRQILITSKVSDEAVDLPNARLLIELSGKAGDAVQESQRLGRLLRPKEGPVYFFTLVTRATVEEASARTRRRILEAEGVNFTVFDFEKEPPTETATAISN